MECLFSVLTKSKTKFWVVFNSFNAYSIFICDIRRFVEYKVISLPLFWTVYPEFSISDPGIGLLMALCLVIIVTGIFFLILPVHSRSVLLFQKTLSLCYDTTKILNMNVPLKGHSLNPMNKT